MTARAPLALLSSIARTRGPASEPTHPTTQRASLVRAILEARAPFPRGGGAAPRPWSDVPMLHLPTPFGDATVVRRIRPADRRHGERSPADLLGRAGDGIARMLLLAGDDARRAGADPTRWLFVDAEATGLGGFTGNLAFVLAFGRYEGDAFVIDQYLVRSYEEEAAALHHAAGLIGQYDAAVSFNGRAFDVPLLETRAAMNGIPGGLGLARLAQVDLLPAARRVFGDRLPDVRLQTLEQEVLGIRRHDDLPGHLVPRAWFEYQHTADARPLLRVLTHNELDVASLPLLAALLADAAGPAPPWTFDARPLMSEDRRRAHIAVARRLDRLAADATAAADALAHARRARDLLEAVLFPPADVRGRVERRIQRLSRRLDAQAPVAAV